MALTMAAHPILVRDHASRVTRAGSVFADTTNLHRRIKSSPSTKHHNVLFPFSSRPCKAPPTLSLSATCASSSQSRALLPSPPDLPDVRSVIPFPSTSPADDVASVMDVQMFDGTTDSVDSQSFPSALFSSCNGTASPCSAQTRLRKRRSQAIATLSQPSSPRRDKKAKSRESSRSGSTDPVVRKRSRKSWRQVADLMILATVHRSLVSNCSTDPWDCVQGEDVAPVDAQTLEGQDVLLARRIQTRLIEHGWSLVTDGIPEMPRDHDASIPSSAQAESSQSIHSDTVLNLHSLSSDTLSPRSSPPPTSAPMPSVLTMPQLVATLMMRNNDRCSTRSRSSWKARRADSSSGHFVQRKSSLSVACS
ncbi:uncharacterized protein F5891DRAFT_1113222 [Suillus fuscotomentosus]|uniref:Uncharacterized protein n=1 Tax=Suillus fuscotomentosus TaxID=1912939 RepID=A0AAD4HJ49_9AGAM|nr:uncharacterized protein F5891DRAFT_1113222 [Suillus fuscotomentosus]KAG1897404.1 hypothetical protein F5891DRAFT_1113222 [Suillus fuscotomentosus]